MSTMQRLVILLPADLLAEIDQHRADWSAVGNMPSRIETMRRLLRLGLDTGQSGIPAHAASASATRATDAPKSL